MVILLLILGIVLMFIFFIKLSNKISYLDRSQESILLLLREVQKQLLEKRLPNEISNSIAEEKDEIIAPTANIVPENDEKPIEVIESKSDELNTPVLPIDNVLIAVKEADEIEAETFIDDQNSISSKFPEEVHQSWFERFRNNNPDFEKFIGENLIN